MGRLSVACTTAGVAKVTYGDPPGPLPPGPEGTVLGAALGELEEYFAGRRRSFSVPVDLSTTSGARRTVLSVLHDSVGFGETITYGGLAARAGLQSAPEASGTTLPPARVVGQVMASNPCAVIVPCHRVVAGAGLGGYSGGAGPEIKQWLLIFEGALPPTLDWSPEGVALPG